MGSAEAISPENIALANILLKRHSQFLLPQASWTIHDVIDWFPPHLSTKES